MQPEEVYSAPYYRSELGLATESVKQRTIWNKLLRSLGKHATLYVALLSVVVAAPVSATAVPSSAVPRHRLSSDVPTVIRGSLELAKSALSKNNLRLARRHLATVLRRDPDYAPAYALYSETLLDDDDARRREAARFRRNASREPDRAAHWYAVGWLGNDDEALAAFDRVITIEPESPWGHLGRAVHLLEADRSKDALSELELARKLAPNEPEVLSVLVTALSTDAASYATARAVLDELVRVAPREYITDGAFAALMPVSPPEDRATLGSRYLELFPRGPAAEDAWIAVLLAKQSVDPEAAARKARQLLATSGLRLRNRSEIYRRFVVAFAAAQGSAALEQLSRELLTSRERSPELFLALAADLQAAAADSRTQVSLFLRGLRLLEAQQRDEMTDFWKDQFLLGLGVAFTTRGESRKALTYLDRISTATKRKPGVLAARGAALSRIGDDRQAFEAYVAAVAGRASPSWMKEAHRLGQNLGLSESETESRIWGARDRAAQPASAFQLPTSDRSTLTLSSLRGKVVVLTFWSSSCAPCVVEVKHLPRLLDLLPRDRVQIVAFAVDGSDDQIKEAQSRTIGTVQFVRGSADKAAKDYGVDAYPETLVVDERGMIMFRHAGFDPIETIAQLTSEIELLLSREAPKQQ